MVYTADFETTTETPTRVWACGIYCLESGSFEWANNIDILFSHFKRHPSSKYFFHNLKFDGEFIFSYLLRNGYEFTLKRKLENKQFSSLISDKGVFYSIIIKDEDGNRVEIYDSYKLLPFKVEEIPAGFGLESAKGEIDYSKVREVGYKLTEEEIEYLYHDVEIVGKALKTLRDEGLDRTTTASNSLAFYKKLIGKKNFSRWFPPLECDSFLRESYKGGFTYCNPDYEGKDIGSGIVLDVNSLYPYVLKSCKLPYGEPKKFDGEYVYDKDYPLFICKIRCMFKLKDGHIPTIQIKRNMNFCPTEYLESSEDEIVELTMTSIDLKLLEKHYEVKELEFLGGYKFKSSDMMFCEYIDYWIEKKIEADKSGNKALRTIAKLMMNSLYGKFGLNPKADRKEPYLEGGVVKYKLIKCEERETIYVALASFVTSYAREITISSAQKVKDRFLYADTDSLHLAGLDIPDGIKIDKYELGAWKIENKFEKARFLHAKCYIEVVDGETEVTIAGLPKKGHSNVTWENFHKGATYEGKLQMCHVEGGILLNPIDFTVKI